MNLVIRAVMLDEQALEEPLLGIFDARGGTIGRSEANTLALPDPERRLSRLQAEVSSGATGYVIRNAGSTTTILLNERPLAPGDSGRLAHRDELRLGGYVLRVLLEDAVTGPGASRAHVAVDARGNAADPAVDVRTDPRFMSPRPGAGRAAVDAGNPFADLVSAPSSAAAGTSGDPLGDPFAFLSAPDPTPARTPAASPSAARAVLPDDFDPFADLAGPSAASSAATLRMPGAGADVDLLASVGAGSGRSAGLDEAFGLVGTDSADALAAFMSASATPASRGRTDQAPHAAISTDPLAMFAPPSAPAAAAPARPAAAFNHTAELHGAYTPPRIVDPAPRRPAEPAAMAQAAAPPTATILATGTAPVVPMVKTPAPAPTSDPVPAGTPAAGAGVSASAQPSALWSAFCAGAGVSLPMPHGLTPEHMHLLGQLLRASIDGTRQLLAQREAERRGVRVSASLAGARDHNPLLFAADTQVALERLLLPPVRGFMPAPAAMRGAMQALAEHGMATASGSHAGLSAALARFEPQQLEALLVDKGLLAINRKAKVWEQYQQRYEAVRKDAQERFRAQLAVSLGDISAPPTRP